MTCKLLEKAAASLVGIALGAGALALSGCSSGRLETYPLLEDRVTPGIFLDPEERVAVGPDVPSRKVSAAGLELTKTSEGFVGRLYHDAAQYCTIAYGHLVKRTRCDGSEPDEFRAGLTEPRGAEILASDMGLAERAVSSAVTVDLTDGQFAALCDFVYNVGARNFGSSTLLRVVNARQYEAVSPQLRRWVKAGGKELPGLRKRREREIVLFFEGLPMPRLVEGEELAPVDVRTGER